MEQYKNLGDMLEKCPTAYNYYSSLSYDVQEMLNDSTDDICSENELMNYVENYIGIGEN